MPNPKFGTVTKHVADAVKDLTGKMDFREKDGVIRMAIGQLAFSEAQLAQNIRMFLEQLKKEFAAISFKSEKAINEVVLSSTHGAGFSLSGEIRPIKGKETGGEEGQVKEEQSTGEAAQGEAEIADIPVEAAPAPAAPTVAA